MAIGNGVVNPLTGYNSRKDNRLEELDADPEFQRLLAEEAEIERSTRDHHEAPSFASDGEVRVVDPDTGASKGQKDRRYDLIPVTGLDALARHYGVGAKKYDKHNWRKGYDWSLSYAALQRHATQWWGGEDIDEETGSHHMAAVAFHAFALIEFALTHPEKDDRYVVGSAGVVTVPLDLMRRAVDALSVPVSDGRPMDGPCYEQMKLALEEVEDA